MARQFDIVVEKDSAGYFVASVPALPGCHTQAKSLDELMERIREAIELCLEVQGEPPEPLDFVGVQRITLHDLASQPHRQGISSQIEESWV
ncbi:MAG: type II toxin-antitoxin system HicB family antitoxin [Gammaproteobacteria bacterium]